MATQKERVAIVTGSANGIGRAIALKLAEEGVHVVVNCRTDVAAGNEVVSTIIANGGRAVLAKADVGNPNEIRSLFDVAEAEFGGIDIFVHNAFSVMSVPLVEATVEHYDELYAVNARATFVGFGEAARRVRDEGRLIYISSAATLNGGTPGTGLYAASKAAGQALVRPFANELGRRQVTVNAVMAGVTRTRTLQHLPDNLLGMITSMTSLGRLGEPEEIADVVAFLASRAGRWVTGQSILASGGLG